MKRRIEMLDFFGKLLNRKNKKTKPICSLCNRPIEDTAYMAVRGAIILDGSLKAAPAIFTCPEQAFNYYQGFFAHSVCWIGLLEKLNVPLYDLGKVYEEYNKKEADKNGVECGKSNQ